MSLREAIWKEIDLATRDKQINIKNQQQLTDEIIKLIVKGIDELRSIRNLKPAENPDDVIYNAGVYDGMYKVKEMLEQ